MTTTSGSAPSMRCTASVPLAASSTTSKPSSVSIDASICRTWSVSSTTITRMARPISAAEPTSHKGQRRRHLAGSVCDAEAGAGPDPPPLEGTGACLDDGAGAESGTADAISAHGDGVEDDEIAVAEGDVDVETHPQRVHRRGRPQQERPVCA